MLISRPSRHGQHRQPINALTGASRPARLLAAIAARLTFSAPAAEGDVRSGMWTPEPTHPLHRPADRLMCRLIDAQPALAVWAAGAYGRFCRRIDPAAGWGLWSDRWEVADEAITSRRKYSRAPEADDPRKLRAAEDYRATCNRVLEALRPAAERWSTEQHRRYERALAIASDPEGPAWSDPEVIWGPQTADDEIPF